uniref:Small ribosomal subunit protein uS4c n=4 Tax=Lethocolea TaxID=280815 RepID=A0PF51_9MARC|nr:small ribosomal protein 4 [Lethocolea glossophylla]CAL39301.1 small ribosomal protein 4 [Lethocolea glossophylla]
MSRYRGPRVKIIRRLGALPGLTSKTLKAKSTYIDHSTSNKKVSQYRIRLEEKQKLRFHYGVTERQLLKYVRIARKAKGSTGQVLLQLPEMRLDNTIFRLGMASTIPGARQLVNHRHISINNDIVDIPSYNCEPGDVITVKDKQKSQSIIIKNIDLFQKSKVPSHLTFDPTELRGLVNQTINRDLINLKINELLVVEYYSRQV